MDGSFAFNSAQLLPVEVGALESTAFPLLTLNDSDAYEEGQRRWELGCCLGLLDPSYAWGLGSCGNCLPVLMELDIDTWIYIFPSHLEANLTFIGDSRDFHVFSSDLNYY